MAVLSMVESVVQFPQDEWLYTGNEIGYNGEGYILFLRSGLKGAK